MAEVTSITSPVGRMVAGSLYKGNDKNFDGKPLVSQKGEPRLNFFFALAIPKGQETHWAQTAWGAEIWRVGHTAFPQAAQRPDFAWKLDDGDSTVPNKKNRKPCDQEGYPGHWVLKFSGGFAPKIYRQENGGWVQVTEENYLKPGYYAQVAFNVAGNGQQNNPGVYLNPQMVAFAAYGPEITFGPDVNEAGFGQAPLPAGASAVPLAVPLAGPAPLPAVPGAPAPSSGSVPSPVPAVPGTPAPATVAASGVVPKPEFANVPLVPSAGVAGQPSPHQQSGMPGIALSASTSPSSPLPPPPRNQMTALAGGSSRETFHAAGWTDAQLIAGGYMTA